MVLDPQRWLELRRFRGLVESGAMSLSEVAKETGLNWRTVSKYLSADSSAPPRRTASGQPRKRVVDEVAPLIDAMLRAEVLMKAAVIHERLATEYGFTGNYQRVKLYVQEARPRIGEELPFHCIRRRSDSPATTTSTSMCWPPTGPRAKAASNARC